MNRYRTIPGFSGQPKASASTICQKCLKKDTSSLSHLTSELVRLTTSLRHYSYECKSSNQERPYVSRPSRTQQLLNPKLAPRLASDTANDLLRKTGIADEQLAKAEAERTKPNDLRSRSTSPKTGSPIARGRSMSSHSSNSISTISTNRSRSRSRGRGNRQDRDDYVRSQVQRPDISRSQSRSPVRKRKRHSMSLESTSRSPYRSRSREHKTRRHRKAGPEDRGRPSSERRGSHRSRSRSRSRSPSMDKSRITKLRRSLDDHEGTGTNHRDGKHDRRGAESPNRRKHDAARRENGRKSHPPRQPPSRKERSLSPFSKRLALTQSMNMPR